MPQLQDTSQQQADELQKLHQAVESSEQARRALEDKLKVIPLPLTCLQVSARSPCSAHTNCSAAIWIGQL